MQTDAIIQSYLKFKQAAESWGAMLLPVTKNHAVEKIKVLYDAGCRDFAENKVQEIVAKKDLLPADIKWHLIGHLQSNKVKYIAPYIAMIHSIDSEKLLFEVEKQGQKHHRKIPCLLQVHVAQEETKYGFLPVELKEIIQRMAKTSLQNVQILGLMAMASFTDNEQQIANEFAQVKAMFDEISQQALPEWIQMQHLSMGMSNDYHLALKHGSTIIRVGSAILGAR
jgi:pyridoxal phosphate enzyme (YggS family)